MTQHTFSVHWSVDQGPSITDAAGELSQTCYGLPGLRSGQSTCTRFVTFDDWSWWRAQEHIGKIKTWLKNHGAIDVVVMIDHLYVEVFMQQMLSHAYNDLQLAATRLKSMRRIWPNKSAQADRLAIETTIEEICGFVKK